MGTSQDRASLPGVRVLVVEDDVALRGVLVAQLRRLGVSTTDVGDAESALLAIRAQPFDLICLDLVLPGQSGFSVCRAIRENPATRSIPVLVVTARGSLEDYARALEVGANGFLRKPFKNRELQANVIALLTKTVA